MRINVPVTNVAYTFSAHQTLVSMTDPKGRIIYCNDAFVEVSGFSREELLGQPHNMVRHPDMPAEAFRDMWATIQGQQPWSGLVKNRRKNGDHYWVRANATPMLDGGRVVGFLSVRTLPTQAEVGQAEKLYAELRQDSEHGRQRWRLERAVPIRQSLWGRLRHRLQLGTFGRMAALQLVLLSVVIASEVARLPLLWGVLSACAVVGLSLWLQAKLFIHPLAEMIGAANRMAAGDLTTSITQNQSGLVGDLQQALRQMSLNLRTVVGDVREDLGRLTRAVSEIASGNQDLSSRTESQAGSLQETAVAMEEVHRAMQTSADHALQGASLAQDTFRMAQRSHEAVQRASSTMDEIHQAFRRIQDIIGIIEGVAFQTNLLALNAAVEAARAGEAGRGFSVVANEVRNLAHRASNAAGEIRQLIGVVGGQVTSGHDASLQALQRMSEALGAVESVGVVLDEISGSASEQRGGIGQVHDAIHSIDDNTQRNAAMVEQLAAATQSLRTQLESVRDTMRMFRISSDEPGLGQTDAVALRRQMKEGTRASLALARKAA